MKKALSLIVFCFYLLTTGFGQQTTDLREVFLAAESYYLFEEFDEALPSYLRLHREFPDNYNLYFKIGVCYLNNPYEKDKSIFYLEKASENINPKYKESNFKELGAPLDALFFLGNAYRINNELDKARGSYKKFQSQMDSEIFNDKLVLEQLTACDVAEKLMKKPVDLDVEILSNQVNTRFADVNPAVSGDETKMVYISKLQFYDAVFYTEKKNGVWSFPRNLNSELGVDADAYPTCLSYDGTFLIIYRNDDFTGNLYSSSLIDGIWTPLVKLNENINTKYWESHASLTKDGNTLYFTSNRKGGFGGLDIYRSSKLLTGDWGPPVNLGPSVNTSYNEETPFISEDGRKLYFSSYGHYNMGGYDVFMSEMQSDSSWSSPVNLGYPVNSTDDDVFFCPVKNGEIAYYPVYKETGYGKHDIYTYKIYNDEFPRKYDISGVLNYSGVIVSGSEISIRVLSKGTGDTLAIVHPDEQGNFTFNMPTGKYSLVFDSERFKQEIKSLEVSLNTPNTGIILSEEIILVPLIAKLSREDLEQKLQVEDSILNVTNSNPVVIEYEAEKGSVIIIRQYLDSILVKLDTIQIDKHRQGYEFIPQPGLNRLEFILTDRDGNTITKTISAPYFKDSVLSQALPREQLNKNNTGQLAAQENSMPQDSINATSNDLSMQAEGRMKDVPENPDLKKEGVTNTEDLLLQPHPSVDRGIAFTLGIFGLLGIIILILILVKKKKEKSK